MARLILKPLAEQVIVIAGASSGIGLATARAAAQQGARVLLVSRNEAALRQIVTDIVMEGGTADCHAADVGDEDAVRAAAAHAVQRFGRIDTWVNAASVAIYARLVDLPDDEHRRVVQTNYFGVVHGVRAAVPHLRDHGGALITVGSIGSEMPTPVMGAYAATKHAVRGYISALRMELMEDGAPISVTLVKPSGIDTPIGQHARNHLPGKAQVPPPRYHPRIVADAILACAVRPRREITVGGAGRMQVLFANHFPAMYERLAPTIARTFIDRHAPQPEPSNLFASVRDGRERSGEHAARQRSVYTLAAQHRWMGLASIGAAVGIAAWLRRRSQRSI